GGQSGSNFPLNFSTLTLNAASTVEYNSSTSGQTIYDVSSPGYGSLTLTNNSTKTAGGSLDIRGNLTNNSTSTFSAGNSLTHNISGNWTNNGAFTYSTASTIVLKGSAQQLISGTAIFNNLTINNTANNAGGDILLNNTNMTITGTCTFTDGIINSLTGNLVIFNNNALASGANNASFVNVPVRKIGNNAFTFPVGKLNVGYMRCGISAPGSATDAFTAEYKRASATALGPVTAPGLYRVSGCEYWQIDRTTGSSNVNVTLSWSGLSPCNAAAYVTNLSFLTVAHFNGTSWDTHAVTSYTGNASSGTITRNGVSVFSPFSIGSTSATTNPLPIKFADVKAYSVNNGNKIEWTNMTEENIARYEVERSGNGISFTSILTADPKTNNGQENKYAETDGNILAGINYYRVKAVQSDGSYLYSTIVKVSSSASTERNISVYPNPVIGTQFTLQLNNYKSGSYSLLLLNGNGQQVMTKTIQHRGGTISVSVEKPETILPGVYILQLKGDNSIDNMKLVIR
ncbi:MAG: T9SS type A sorting domain-containing protein, partial [Bacteroidetes bacterium]|nr:T9SS type A sorting domain-containing protein [Bacteroidota bacterium]